MLLAAGCRRWCFCCFCFCCRFEEGPCGPDPEEVRQAQGASEEMPYEASEV